MNFETKHDCSRDDKKKTWISGEGERQTSLHVWWGKPQTTSNAEAWERNRQKREFSNVFLAPKSIRPPPPPRPHLLWIFALHIIPHLFSVGLVIIIISTFRTTRYRFDDRFLLLSCFLSPFRSSDAMIVLFTSLPARNRCWSESDIMFEPHVNISLSLSQIVCSSVWLTDSVS